MTQQRQDRRASTAGKQVPAEQRRAELDDLTLARARRGERAALTRLIDCYSARVYALIGRMLVERPASVDDVAQETMIKVINGLPRFDPKGAAALSTWILTIATRTCIDHLRRRRIEPADPGHALELVASGAGPEGEAAARERVKQVEAAVARLSADQRAVLLLRVHHGLEYAEIAEALALEPGTVKSRLGRAREAVRRALEERR